MGKLKRPPEQPTQAPANWKWMSDHPIWVLAVAVAAAVGATATVFVQFFHPVEQQRQAREISQLQEDLLRARKDLDLKSRQVEDRQAEVARLDQSLRDTEQRLAVALHANLFLAGDAYPNGWRLVKIHEPVDAVVGAYGQLRIDKSKDGVYAVHDPKNVVSRASFFWDFEGKDRRITHILFEIEDEKTFDKTFLQTKLVEVLGTPKRGAKDTHFAWAKPRAYGVFKMDAYGYYLVEDGGRPHGFKDR